MGLNSLLGSYDSDDDEKADKAASPPGRVETPASTECAIDSIATTTTSAPLRKRRGGKVDGTIVSVASDPISEKHGPACNCEDCSVLLARFTAKTVQTKGIRFKCKLCDAVMASKVESQAHFQVQHRQQLQDFKRQKNPRIFDAPTLKAGFVGGKKISFRREDVLGKRPADDDGSFGGFAKKEKPELPPCERPEYQEMMHAPIFTAPPWMTQSRPSMEEATPEDLALDECIAQAQMRRFSSRNVLTVSANVVRCKLCYKTWASAAETEHHIHKEHADDQKHELRIWERFLHTCCKRQPPFGWVCKICNLFFPTDSSVWRHIGKECFVRQEERHLEAWHEKEDRWGHEEDEECCGDGINIARGLSYETVKRFNEQQRKMDQEAEAAAMDEDILRRRDKGLPLIEKDDSDEEAKQVEPGEEGRIDFINEF